MAYNTSGPWGNYGQYGEGRAYNQYQNEGARSMAEGEQQWNAYLQRMRQYAPTAGLASNPRQQGSTDVPAWTPDARGVGTSGATLGSYGRPGQPAYNASDPFYQAPKSWWSADNGGVPGLTQGALANNPDAVVRLWSQSHGLGENTMRMLRDFSDPVTVLQGLGYAENIDDNTGARLDLIGQLFGQQLGADKGNSGYTQYIEPRQIINRAINARVQYDPTTGARIGGANSFVDALAEPSLPPENQVQNFVRFVGSAVQGLLPSDSFDALMRVYQQEADSFMLYKLQNPTDGITFNKWVGDRLGPNGGL